MKRIELIKLLDKLNAVDQTWKYEMEFSYGIARDIKILEPVVEILKKQQQQPPEKYIEFEKKKMDLVREYSVKDVNGNPDVKIQNGQQLVAVTNQQELTTKITSLADKYKEAIETFDRNEKEYNSFLQEEFIESINLYKINKSDLPKSIDIKMILDLDLIIKHDSSCVVECN
jgi:hypothetical protein